MPISAVWSARTPRDTTVPKNLATAFWLLRAFPKVFTQLPKRWLRAPCKPPTNLPAQNFPKTATLLKKSTSFFKKNAKFDESHGRQKSPHRDQFGARPRVRLRSRIACPFDIFSDIPKTPGPMRCRTVDCNACPLWVSLLQSILRHVSATNNPLRKKP